MNFMERNMTNLDTIKEMRSEFMRTGKPVMRVVTITPEWAATLLDSNQDNRQIRQQLIDTIAADIREGRWELNGETIIISEEGFVNDGQHRLYAIIEAETPVESALVYGVRRQSRNTVDIGRVRSVADFLGMSGTQASRQAAFAAGHLLRWEYNALHMRGSNSKGESKTEIVQYYQTHTEEINFMIEQVTGAALRLSIFGSRAFVAFTLVIFSRKSGREAALDFWHQLFSGENLPTGSPILYLRNRFEQERRMLLLHRLELMVRAWNAWREGRTVKTIPVTGQIPEIHR